MNYYERYCGDYAKKTARLSLMEHGAYTLLLDEYYSNEAPLPADFDELFRICRAMKKAEQDAVRSVAEKFFPIDQDGMRHNARADEMIARARPKMQAARENGKRGGRPPKNPPGSENGNPNETHEKPSGKPSGFSERNPGETQDETTRAFPNPNPNPIGSKSVNAYTDGVGSNNAEAAVEISKSLRSWERERGKAVRNLTPSQQQVIDLAACEPSAQELRQAYELAVEARENANDPGPINASFVRSKLEQLRRPPPPKREQAIPLSAMTDSQRDDLGRKLGIGGCRAGESRDAFIARIRAKQAEPQGAAA